MYVLPVKRVKIGDLGQWDLYDESATDWTGVIDTAIRTWGSVESGKTQAEMQRAQRAQLTPYVTRPLPTVPRYGSQYPSQPGYSPFPGGAGGSAFMGLNLTTWMVILIGAAAIYIYQRK